MSHGALAATGMSVSDVEKVVHKANGWLTASSKVNKHFGIGGPSEAACETFRAFMECKGYLTSDKRAVELPSGSTLDDARSHFGRDMRQTIILDEDGYKLDASSPLWRYSKNCNISLVFVYDKKTEAELAREWVRKKLGF